MKTVGCSDVGMRRKQNEDCFCFGELEDGISWAVVCDGMGGASGGQIASKLATDMVSTQIEKCYNKLMTERSIENLLLSSITAANLIVFDKSEEDITLKGMGTTIVACVVKEDYACIAHVGDSRAYFIHDGKISQITKDHSLVQEMLDNGQITEEEFKNHPNKNIITRALGVGEKIEIDFNHIVLQSGDAVVLCTDGLSGPVSDEKILEIYQNSDFEQSAFEFIKQANENGGPDNITAVVINYE